jgi:hypothetical protein
MPLINWCNYNNGLRILGRVLLPPGCIICSSGHYWSPASGSESVLNISRLLLELQGF